MLFSLIVPINAFAGAGKVTICHRTKSITNPYRLITVSQSAATNAAGHKGHTGGVFNTTSGYYIGDGVGTNAKNWGDIIPGSDADGDIFNGSNAFDLNWTTDGKAFFPGGTNASKCARMTPKQFYDLQVANGVSTTDAIADLNAQNANEDVEIKAALGGSFSTTNIADSDTSVGVTTSDATSITTTSATLNGSVKANSTPMKWQFEYGTDANLATGTTITTLSATGVAGSAATTTTTESKSTAIIGLVSGTTYYFRIIGVTNSGTDTEAIYYGAIKSFSASNPVAQAIDFIYSTGKTYGDSSFSISATSKTPNASGTATGLLVTFSSETDSKCSVGSSSISSNISSVTITILGAGDCTIRASQSGGMSGGTNYSAAANVDQTFTISPKSITITAEDKSKNFGQADPTFTYTYSSTFVGSDAVSTVSKNFAGTGGTTYASSSSTPTAVGTYSITPTGVTLSVGSTSNYNFIYVAGIYTINAVATPSVSTDSLPSGTVSSAYSTTLAATGGSGVYSTWALTSGTLPTGLTLNTSSGAITGTPTTSGTSNITVTVTDNNSQTSSGKSLIITITALASTPSPRFTPPNPAKDPEPKIKLKVPASKNPPTPASSPNTPIKRPNTPPVISDPLAKETLPLINDDNEDIKVQEVKSNSPVKTKVNEKGNVELIVPIGYKGEIEIEVTEKNGGPSEKLKIPVEGPKPSVEPKEESKALPRLAPEKPGEVKVISGDNKVTLSWVKDPEAKAYDIYSDNKLLCSTVYSVCTLPAENGVSKKYEVIPVMSNGIEGPKISGSGRALASGTLLAIVYFDTDKSSLRSDAKATLNKLVNDLYALGLRDVSLSGHTDTQASTKYNDRLSNNRSKIVDAYLGKAVIDAYLTKDSYNEKKLAVKTKDEVNQQLNRRVEIRVK